MVKAIRSAGSHSINKKKFKIIFFAGIRNMSVSIYQISKIVKT